MNVLLNLPAPVYGILAVAVLYAYMGGVVFTALGLTGHSFASRLLHGLLWLPIFAYGAIRRVMRKRG